MVVAFLLTDRTGHASEVAVVEAAKRFVNEQRFSTNCPGARFDVRMRFTLRDRYLQAPTR